MIERSLLMLLLLVAAGCTSRDPGGSSSATNFLACKVDHDCVGHAGAVRCDVGFCVDSAGDRIAANARSSSTGGSTTQRGSEPDAAAPATKSDASASNTQADAGAPQPADDAGAAPRADSGVQSPRGDAGASVPVDSGLKPIAQCGCNTSTDVKMPITEFEARPGQMPDILVVKFHDGSRVRVVEGELAPDPAGRDAQDLAELDCGHLDFASADKALAQIKALLAQNPSVVVTPEFTLDPAVLNDMRDFEGRHCAEQGGEALADLSNWYRWTINPADGPTLMHALDANVLVTNANYVSIAVPAGQ